MVIRLKVEGIGELRAELGNLGGDFDDIVEAEIHKAANRYRDRVKALHRAGPHTGRIYIKPGGRRHQASAPGQPPAPDTKALMRSIKVKLGSMSAEIGSILPYSRHLEFGTRRMAARPMWLPTLVFTGKTLRQNIENAVRRKV